MVMDGSVEARTTRANPSEPDPSPWRALAEGRIGQVVGGRLKLERVLGVGGTAAVYAARHRNGRALAVKILHPAFAHQPNIRQRFLAEGYAANKVDHPDAVAILDEGEDAEGNVFIVMELLQGESLLERLKARGPLAKAEVVSIALSVLDVLAQAHDRGVVHRDIKPGNLFQTDTGAIKVLDFGIARVQGGSGEFSTHPGSTLGTPAFMAPELAAGRLEELDALTDLWAVGATMFQLLTGETVHPSETDARLIVLAATRAPRSLGSLRPELEPWLIKVVDRALAFERRARWPNARAMSAALFEPAQREGMISGARSVAVDANETAPEMALPPSRPAPHPRLHGAVGWALVSLLVLGFFGSVLALQHEDHSTPTKKSAVPPPEQPPTQVASGARAPSEIEALPSAREEPPLASSGGSTNAPPLPPSSNLPTVKVPRPLATVRLPRVASSAPSLAPASPSSNPLFFPNQ